MDTTSRKLFGAASSMPVLLRNETLPSPSHLLDSFWITDSSPTFHGVVGGEERKDRAFFQPLQEEENGEEDLEGCFHRPEKKRRLTVGQVQFLERSFEVENKLEPERKNQLAKELGLQPRQVAIWFQNRRARFKTKQLEKDYDFLKASYDTLKANYDRLLKDKEKLASQVILLREKAAAAAAGEGISPSEKAGIPNACKQEDASSNRSDVYDPDSPLYTEGNHSSLVLEQEPELEPEPEPEPQFSQEEEEEDNLNLGNALIMPPCFPKLEDCSCHDLDHHPPLGLMPAAEEQHPIWFWSY